MKLHNPFKFNNPSVTLLISVSISLIAIFYGLMYLTFLVPGGVWISLAFILVPAVGRSLYAIFKGE